MRTPTFKTICEVAFVASCILPFILPTTAGTITALIVLPAVIIAFEVLQVLKPRIKNEDITSLETNADDTNQTILDLQRQLQEHDDRIDRISTSQGMKNIL